MTDQGWPHFDAAADLHRRLAAHDPTAPADFAEAVLDPLLAYLRAKEPSADDHHRVEAAEEAVLSVIRNPAVYDPARGELPAFLRMAARRDLENIRAKEWRHQRKREVRDCVELAAPDGNSLAGVPSFDDPELAPLVAALPDAERQVLDLMRTGERRTEAFAAVLGLGGRPAAEQRREVKRVKDRLTKRLQRMRTES